MIQGRRVCPNNGFVLSLFNLFPHLMEERRGRYKRQIQTQMEMLPDNGKQFFQSMPVMSFFPVVVVVVVVLHFAIIKLIFIKCPFL